jgi:hypothetical protein
MVPHWINKGTIHGEDRFQETDPLEEWLAHSKCSINGLLINRNELLSTYCTQAG